MLTLSNCFEIFGMKRSIDSHHISQFFFLDGHYGKKPFKTCRALYTVQCTLYIDDRKWFKVFPVMISYISTVLEYSPSHPPK
jgi:hypothetical protein